LETKKLANGNGSAALTRLVWWAIGIGAVVVIGAGSFFAVSYLGSLNEQIKSLNATKDERGERISIIEGRIATLENTASSSLSQITRSLDKMELWQEQVRQDIAELKAAAKIKP
jgi:hypothetical protein